VILNGDLTFLHDFQEGCLRLRRGTIHLIGEHQVGEQRAGAKLKLPPFLVINEPSGDIPRQQVRRKLNALKRQTGHLGDEACDEGLGQPWKILNENVPPTVQTEQ